MENTDFKKFSPEDLGTYLLTCRSSSLKQFLDELSTSQLCGMLTALNNQLLSKENEEKLIALFSYIEDRKKIELISQYLNYNLFITLIKECEQQILTSVIVGIPYAIFRKTITDAPNEIFQLLQQVSVTEPVQHQLTLTIHDLKNQMDAEIIKIGEFQLHLQTLNPKIIKTTEIQELFHLINELYDEAEQNLHLATRALTLAWKTGREDLVEVLSDLKESWIHLRDEGIGVPGTVSGLYQQLEQKLGSIYGSPTTQDIEALNDSEPAIEGLTRFSIWYLTDYYKLGLLPSIKKIQDLEPQTDQFESRNTLRQKLFQEACATLEKSGLKTIGDLKKNHIFSLESLKTYLQKINHLSKHSSN